MPDYYVKVGDQEPIMVRAKNNIAARNYGVRGLVVVRVLTTEDAIEMASKGRKLEVAGEDVPATEDGPAQDGEQEQAGEPGKQEAQIDSQTLAEDKPKTPRAKG